MNLFELIITQPIFNIVLAIYQAVGDFGVAIIIFTVLAKLVMYPLYKHSIEQSKKIRQIQPELAKIRKESNGNRQIEAMRQMQLYKDNDIKMFRSMLITIIQAVVFITLFSVLSMIIRQPDQVKRFAYQPVANMDKVQQIVENKFEPKLFGTINLSAQALPINSKSSLFLLLVAILASLTQYYTIKKASPNSGKNSKSIKQIFAEAADGKQPDQSEMNLAVSSKMMGLFPILMLITSVNIYGAMTFYYFVNGLLTALQQKYVFDIEPTPKIVKEKTAQRAKKAKEAKIVPRAKKSAGEKSNVRRIKAKDNKRKG